jgi:hypothetical protein
MAPGYSPLSIFACQQIAALSYEHVIRAVALRGGSTVSGQRLFKQICYRTEPRWSFRWEIKGKRQRKQEKQARKEREINKQRKDERHQERKEQSLVKEIGQ